MRRLEENLAGRQVDDRDALGVADFNVKPAVRLTLALDLEIACGKGQQPRPGLAIALQIK